MLIEIESLLRDHWDELGLPVEQPDRLDFLVQFRGRIAYFVFAPGRNRPVLIVKVARSREDEGRIRNELRTLNHLQETLPAAMAQQVPRHLLHEHINGRAVWFETVVPGTPMSVGAGCKVSPRLTHSNFQAVLDWLLLFQGHTRCTQPHAPEADMAEEMADAISKVLLHGQVGEQEETYIRDVLNTNRTLERIRFPSVCVHMDLQPSNILVSRKTVVGVVDWVTSRLSGLAFIDWFGFLLLHGWRRHGFLFPDRANWDQFTNALEETFLVENALSQIASHWTRKFFHEYQVESRAIPLCFLYFITQFVPASAARDMVRRAALAHRRGGPALCFLP